MSILQKHVAKEILVPFAVAFTVMTFLTLMGDFLHELADRFLNKGLALREMALMIFYALPTLVTYTIPIALLFATLIAFVQLSQDCEIVAMRAAGIPIRKAFAPAILVGVAATMILLALRTEISPWARRKLHFFVIDTVLSKPTLALNEQTWTSAVGNMRIFVGEIDDRKMSLRDIKILVKEDDGLQRTIVAESGRIYIGDNKKGIFLELSDGSIHDFDKENPERYSTTTFQSLTVPANIEELNRYLRRNSNELGYFTKKEMTMGQIRHKLADPSTSADERRGLLKHIGERTALAFMPLAFVLIGAPLGIIPHKARRLYGPAICAGLVLAYYSLLILGEMIAKGGQLNPLLAMWLPNIFLGAAGAAFMIRAERR